MGQIFQNVQLKLKGSSANALTYILKVASGLIVSLTVAIVGQAIFSYGNFLFFFVIVVVTGLFLKVAKPWGVLGILIFDLICVLVALLLRMYILIAPGA